jgi:hypothetical protein
MVTMTPVQSSTIRAVGWDQATTTLYVSFKNGTTYCYAAVPEAIYNALLSASSVGGYFAEHIRDRYATRKL